MNRDKVTLVDLDDNEIGVENKTVAHAKPLLHRAFSIYLYNDSNEILIQKRADSKYHSGGLWSNACCSHPQKGENVKQSAIERLNDELGITTNIDEIFSFVYMNKFNDNLYEYEYDHVFIGEYNGDVTLDPNEASAIRWISINDLKEELKVKPASYSAWFIISAPKVISYLENKKIGNNQS